YSRIISLHNVNVYYQTSINLPPDSRKTETVRRPNKVGYPMWRKLDTGYTGKFRSPPACQNSLLLSSPVDLPVYYLRHQVRGCRRVGRIRKNRSIPMTPTIRLDWDPYCPIAQTVSHG